MLNKRLRKCRKTGFTLVEIAIVLTIIGIIIYSSVKFSAASLEMAKVRTSKEKIKKIQEAFQLYFEQKSGASDALGYLPCPADPTLAITNASFGIEPTDTNHANATTPCGASATTTGPILTDNTGTPTVYIGTIPTRSIGLPDDFMYDGWGNRLTYAVSKTCTIAFVSSTTASCATTLTVKDSGSANNISTSAAYVVISHGRHGPGGWNKSGTRSILAATDANYQSTYEADNGSYNAAAGTNAINAQFRDGPINDGDYDSADGDTIYENYFDDIVGWQTDDTMQYIRLCKLAGTSC